MQSLASLFTSCPNSLSQFFLKGPSQRAALPVNAHVNCKGMFNQRIDPPSWAIELPGSDIPAERTRARPHDQRPTLQIPRPPALEDDSPPLSAPVTGPETPRWRYTISPVTPYDRTEDVRSQQNAQITSNSRANLVRIYGPAGVERCMLTISRAIDTQSRTQIWQIWALGLLALLTGKSAMVDTSLRDANMD